MAEPRIDILDRGGTFSLLVNDYELADWLEDLLIEKHGIKPLSYDETEAENPPMVCMNFSADVDEKRLVLILESLDPIEVLRIYRLNNA